MDEREPAGSAGPETASDTTQIYRDNRGFKSRAALAFKIFVTPRAGAAEVPHRARFALAKGAATRHLLASERRRSQEGRGGEIGRKA
jgi:hypothetical protein